METNRVVIDTGVFIEHIRAKDKSQTTLATLSPDWTLFVSSVTLYELYCGTNTPEKQADIEALMSNVHELVFDKQTAKSAAQLFNELKRKNQLISPLDILIAATALTHEMAVKTLNINHFSRVDNLVLR